MPDAPIAILGEGVRQIARRDRLITGLRPNLLALGRPPAIVHAAAPFMAEVYAEQRRLMIFYQAGLDAYAGDRAHWADAMAAVTAEDRSNPYYAWFMAGVADDRIR